MCWSDLLALFCKSDCISLKAFAITISSVCAEPAKQCKLNAAISAREFPYRARVESSWVEFEAFKRRDKSRLLYWLINSWKTKDDDDHFVCKWVNTYIDSHSIIKPKITNKQSATVFVHELMHACYINNICVLKNKPNNRRLLLITQQRAGLIETRKVPFFIQTLECLLLCFVWASESEYKPRFITHLSSSPPRRLCIKS